MKLDNELEALQRTIKALLAERHQIQFVEAPRAQAQLVDTLQASLTTAIQIGDREWQRELERDLQTARRSHLAVVARH
ncbi:MAG: hypothetical protein ACYCOR_21115 [Acidobacteriaceae bacterium]